MVFETLLSICSGQRPTRQSIVEASFATFHLHGTTKLSRKSGLPEPSTSQARVEQVESLALPPDDTVDSVSSLYVSPPRVGLIFSVFVLGVYVSNEVVVFLWIGLHLTQHPCAMRPCEVIQTVGKVFSSVPCSLAFPSSMEKVWAV